MYEDEEIHNNNNNKNKPVWYFELCQENQVGFREALDASLKKKNWELLSSIKLWKAAEDKKNVCL